MLQPSKIPAKGSAPLADTYFNRRDIGPERKRIAPICGVVLHTTGGGPGLQAIYDRFGQDERADRAYAQRLSNVLEFKGHYLVGYMGGIYQVVPLDLVAYHTGGSALRHIGSMRPVASTPAQRARIGDDVCMGRNASGALVKGTWFRDRFPQALSPRDLPPWQPLPDGSRSANGCTVGVDLLEPRGGVYSPAQLTALVKLLRHLRHDLGLPKDAVWTHSELDPYSRTNAKGEPWDLGARFPWAELRAQFLA